jgi:hypothetical protein
VFRLAPACKKAESIAPAKPVISASAAGSEQQPIFDEILAFLIMPKTIE